MKDDSLKNSLHFMQWVVLALILFLAMLMANDAYRRSRPIADALIRLDELKAGNLDNPELVQAIRELDYVYRATYFQTQDQQGYGFLLLGIAFIVLCLLTGLEHFFCTPSLKIPQPATTSADKERQLLLLLVVFASLILLTTIVFVRPRAKPEELTLTANSAKAQESEEPIDSKAALLAETQHWPQFRGSVLPNQNSLPAHWQFTHKWQQKIPLHGYSSPVIWADSIFVSGGNAKERSLFCYSAESGELLWQVNCNQAPKVPAVTADTGFAASTPCVDNNRVYAVFATGEVLCCTHRGEIVWQRQLPPADILYGYASSPLLLGDKLILQYDLDDTQTIYALDVRNGKPVWATKRESTASWSSPSAYYQHDNITIFTAGNQFAEAFAADTGQSLWKFAGLGGEVATSAFAQDGQFFFANTGAVIASFSAQDGRVIFRNDNSPAPDVASPVVIGEVFLLFDSGGVAIGLDSKTGEELYEAEFSDGFYASPVVLGGKVVGVNMSGELLLLTVNREGVFTDGKYDLGTKVVSVPAFHRGNIVIRTFANDLLYLEAHEK